MKPRIETLYVHVPFCTHLCPYCDFPKERLAGNRMRDFLRGLQAEWAWVEQEFDISPQRIFFGGGLIGETVDEVEIDLRYPRLACGVDGGTNGCTVVASSEPSEILGTKGLDPEA